MDVVIGSIAPYRSLEDTALAERLRAMERLEKFDLDQAIRRKPDLILMDDLACENPRGSRHSRRYQDIRELLKAGISVYTTVSAQNIESLNDIVTAITRVPVKDRIPDSVFDHADQVELVDLEPRELLERLRNGALAEKEGEQTPETAYFAVASLTALREVALRRCADRINILTRGDGAAHGDEHVLVCLSASSLQRKDRPNCGQDGQCVPWGIYGPVRKDTGSGIYGSGGPETPPVPYAAGRAAGSQDRDPVQRRYPVPDR